MTRSMSAPEPFGTRASNISERSVDANLLAEERLLYDFASNPAEPLATVSPCPYQENIRWRWAALACWLKHAQQRANFEIATDFFADKGWDCGQFRLNMVEPSASAYWLIPRTHGVTGEPGGRVVGFVTSSPTGRI